MKQKIRWIFKSYLIYPTQIAITVSFPEKQCQKNSMKRAYDNKRILVNTFLHRLTYLGSQQHFFILWKKQGWWELDSSRIARVKLEQLKRISNWENNGEQYIPNQCFPVWTRCNRNETTGFSRVYIQSLCKFQTKILMHSALFISYISTFKALV